MKKSDLKEFLVAKVLYSKKITETQNFDEEQHEEKYFLDIRVHIY